MGERIGGAEPKHARGGCDALQHNAADASIAAAFRL